jgi:predicted NAD/FAD-dependent oxidoreductase
VTDVLIVGAGMAGLTAAAELQRAGRRVMVVDKGRGVGGRLASRRIGDASFDHGAQFITTRTSRFATLMEDCRGAGVVEEWHGGNGDASDAHVRWRGRPAMTSIAKHLAHDINITLDTQVVALRASAQGWSAETSTGRVWSADAVVLTPPVPQSLAILQAGAVPLLAVTRDRLERIEYERCLAVMAVLAGPSRLLPPGGMAPTTGPIAWIADNQMKGISATPAVTIHATHTFSVDHWDHDRHDSGRRLLDEAQEWLGADVLTFEVHGWRYSKPLHVDDHRCVMVPQVPPLVLAGDAFGGPRVEGAALSGWAAADAVLAGAS